MIKSRKLRSLCLRILPLFVLSSSLVNVYLAFNVYRRSQPREIISYYEVTNRIEVVSVSTNSLTNVISSASSAFSASPDKSSKPPSCVCRVPYQYFVVDGRIGAHVWGRFYYDGSPCSYGRIYQVYPDRILLVGGDWIENSREWTDYKNERILKNDRRPN